MIHLEVVKSLDPMAQGLYEFEFNQVSVGRSFKNDLIFSDRELPLKFLKLNIIQNQLVVQGLVKNRFFFVNGKKISGVLIIKPGDIISFGGNQIKIVKSGLNLNSQDLSSYFGKNSNQGSEVKFVLDFIEEVLIKSENKADV